MSKKLRVGILTMHRVYNCGSYLQAYALQQVIETMGCDCEIIDYLYPNALHGQNFNYYPITFRNSVQHIWHNIFHGRWELVQKQVHEMRWAMMLNKKLRLSKKSYTTADELVTNPPEYDVYVLGSDQVLNERFTRNDQTFLMGFAPEGKKCISYASSAPKVQFSKNYTEQIMALVSRYSAISTRERESAKVIGEMLNREVDSHVDPVFLLSKDEWEKKLRFTQKNGGYVLYYVLNYMGDIEQEAIDMLMKDIADGRRVYTNMPLYEQKGEQLKEMFPSEFVNTIANAEYVVTDSFHSTAIALLFHVPVMPIVANSEQDMRINDMVTRVGEQDARGFVRSVESKIEEEREKAIRYLRKNINIDKG